MKVLVLYTLPPPGMGERAAEFDISEAAYGVADVLGVAPVGVLGALEEVLAVLDAHRPDVVFNLLEAPLGRPDLDGSLAALLEWRGTPFTGNGSATLALCRRKDHTHAVLSAAGVPVPRSGLDAGFPCFVKPAGEDGSAGIDKASICHDAPARDGAVARIAAAGLGAAVIEAWLPGRELNVALWGAGPARGTQAAVGEITFGPGVEVLTWASKWAPESAEYQCSPSVYPAEIAADLRAAAIATARAAARAVGARGYLRVDLRLDAHGQPRVIDVNPNPDVTPGAGLSRGVASAGWSWEQFVHAQVAGARATQELEW
ncbi:MAG: D-alanine--D-alanine ligase [Pseudomonadota bacterium]|nr:D-alanine--D-alanine ligase [Pseudomonadota bacterium]